MQSRSDGSNLHPVSTSQSRSALVHTLGPAKDGGPAWKVEIELTPNTLKQFTSGNINMLSQKHMTTGGLLLQQQEKQAGSDVHPYNLPHRALCFL